MWIAGDTFLNDIWHALPELESSAIEAQKPVPYMYDYYNLTFLAEPQLINMDNSIVRILNTTIKALNSNQLRMPRIILLIPDFNVLHQIKYFGFGVSQVIGSVLNWLIKNVENAISAKKDQIRHKKPGALHSGEPKVIWLKIFERPGQEGAPSTNATRKSNNILAELIANKKCHYIMDVTDTVSSVPANFNKNSNLNERGMDAFWMAVNQIIKDFDYGKVELKPILPLAMLSQYHSAKPHVHVKPQQHK